MTKVAGERRQPGALGEARCRTVTFLSYSLPSNENLKTKLKLGKGLAEPIFKEFYQKQIKKTGM